MRKLIVSCLVAVSFVLPVKAETQKQELIHKIEKYFDGLKTLKADVVQVNPDQSTSTGRFYWDRPEKFRIHYLEPKDRIFVSDGSVFIEYDTQEDIPNFISLESTPASLFLKPKLRLSGDVSVREIQADANKITVVLYKTKDPDVGTLTLTFSQKPMQLVHWIIHDAQGNVTQVSLNNVVENQPIKDNLFTTSRIYKD